MGRSNEAISFSSLISIVVLTAIAANAQQMPMQRSITFGMVGFVQNQTARLNVLNPESGLNGGGSACSVELSFLNAQAEVLKSSLVRIEEGKAALLDLEWPEVRASGRVQIRAVLKSTILPLGPSSAVPIAVCNVMPTLEIFEKDSGKTTLILSEGRAIHLSAPSGAGAPARSSKVN